MPINQEEVTMSRRKIRNKSKQKKASRSDPMYMSNIFMTEDEDTGEIVCHDATWRVDKAAIPYMPIYSQAHRLMPLPKSMLMNPDEYREEQSPSIALLTSALNGTNVERDDLLRAIAILGHSPNTAALEALSRFSESRHDLSLVASIALSECASLYDAFYSPRHAVHATYSS